MKIAISTGGGDAPGLNAVIRAAVLASLNRGWEVLGIRRGFGGLLGDARIVKLDSDSVRGITHIGGTILGTTNRGNPFRWPVLTIEGEWTEEDRSDELIASARELGIDALIAVGGDGTLHIAAQLHAKGLPVIGVPKTIDNDVPGTAITFGFDTAVNTATEAIDKLHSTAESHERVMVVEVMGRYAGWIALHAGIAGTADVILIPEIPFDLDRVCDKIREREAMGRHFSIVVVAEGAVVRGGTVTVQTGAEAGGVERLGGVSTHVAEYVSKQTGKDARTFTVGHLQRGGTPTALDRVLALQFGAAAVRAAEEGKFGQMVVFDPPDVTTARIAATISGHKPVPMDSNLIRTARELGVSFGD